MFYYRTKNKMEDLRVKGRSVLPCVAESFEYKGYTYIRARHDLMPEEFSGIEYVARTQYDRQKEYWEKRNKMLAGMPDSAKGLT